MELGTSFPAGPLGGIDCGSVVISNNPGSGVVATLTTNGTTALLGTLNFTDSGGFAPGTYTILTYAPSPSSGTPTNFTFAGTIGQVPNTNFTYAIDTNTIGKVNLVVTGPALPFRITSIVRTGSDIKITWNGLTGDNVVQASNGGNFNTNSLSNLATITLGGSAVTNYIDVGAALSPTNRYYRIRGTQ
jgi:hypothetical protein